jgi:hypothetical protein
MEVRDVDAVRSLMFRHIMGASDYLIATLERQGLWDASPHAEATGDDDADLPPEDEDAPKAKPKRQKRA